MGARRLLVLFGSLWDFARFFIVMIILATLFDSAGGWGAGILPWLLTGAASGLLAPVGGVLVGFYPERYSNLVGLLRLGKLLNIFSLALVPLSGAIDLGGGITLLRVGALALSPPLALASILILDLVFLGSLISYGTGSV